MNLAIVYVYDKLTGQLRAARVPFEHVERALIKYTDDATAEERATGDAIFAAFDFDAEVAAYESAKAADASAFATDRDDFEQSLAAAITRLDQIVANNTATAAQVRGYVQDIARIVKRSLNVTKYIAKRT